MYDMGAHLLPAGPHRRFCALCSVGGLRVLPGSVGTGKTSYGSCVNDAHMDEWCKSLSRRSDRSLRLDVAVVFLYVVVCFICSVSEHKMRVTVRDLDTSPAAGGYDKGQHTGTLGFF